MKLRIHRFLPASLANGPGRRAVIWVQGCTLGCPGCFNPETHDPRRGRTLDVSEAFDEITVRQDSLEGVTISGGEPLQQSDAVTELLRRLKRETQLSTLLFTGYSWEETQSHDCLKFLDVLIAGRYRREQHLARGLRGSVNKTIHFLTSRYAPSDLDCVAPAEVILEPGGGVILSGIGPLAW